MNPVRPCPGCGRDHDFHDDELERVADGSAICLDCGMELAMNGWILDVVAGKVDISHLLDDEEEEVNDADK